MNNDYFYEPDKVQLNILGWIDLNKYIGLPITFMGANFENSLIYKANLSLFEKADLEGLLTRTTPLNERLKVYYFSNKKSYLKDGKIIIMKSLIMYTITLMQNLKDKGFTGLTTRRINTNFSKVRG